MVGMFGLGERARLRLAASPSSGRHPAEAGLSFKPIGQIVSVLPPSREEDLVRSPGDVFVGGSARRHPQYSASARRSSSRRAFAHYLLLARHAHRESLCRVSFLTDWLKQDLSKRQATSPLGHVLLVSRIFGPHHQIAR